MCNVAIRQLAFVALAHVVTLWATGAQVYRAPRTTVALAHSDIIQRDASRSSLALRTTVALAHSDILLPDTSRPSAGHPYQGRPADWSQQ